MCGIFGYIGFKNNAAEQVLAGLKLLEYRGYDSWGIAVKKGPRVIIDKHIGKIGDASVNLPQSSIGIGHTRWATHGGVTKSNAHPHYDCSNQIAVLHNGIVENFTEIKEELKQKGHIFVSQTDTETIPHLIEENLKTMGFASAVRDTFNRLSGLNAIVILNAKSSEIIAVKNGSPLVIGVKGSEFYVASDVSGILPHTNSVIFLEDNQMAILGSKLQLLSLPTGVKINPKIHTIDWQFEQSVKGEFKHFMLKEIYDQPQVIENIAHTFDSATYNLAKLIDKAYGTFMLGCGTASYAALAGTYLFSNIAKKHVNFSIGSEFNYLEDYLNAKSLVIPISQSGETIDVIEPVMSAKRKKSHIAALTNVLGSTLYRIADEKILLSAGPEKAVCSTKAFIAMYAVLLLTAYSLAKKAEEGKVILEASSKDVQKILTDSYIEQIKQLAEEIKTKEHMYILGRGVSYAAALEATLKLKETAYIHAEGFAGGELKHGVMALIEKDTPCIVIAPNDETYGSILSNAQEVKARGGFIIGIGPRENDVFDKFLKTEDNKEATLISQIVICQLLAYNLAIKRGVNDPDKPRNLAKSVTVK